MEKGDEEEEEEYVHRGREPGEKTGKESAKDRWWNIKVCERKDR